MVRDRSARLQLVAVLAATLLTPAPGDCKEDKLLTSFYGCMDRSSHIVHGQLDPSGALTVKAVLKGGAIAGRIVIDGNDGVVRSLTWRQEAGTCEVLVFLHLRSDRRWELVFGQAGIVGFQGEEVVYGSENLLRSPDYPWNWVQFPAVTRSSILRTVRAMVADEDRRQRLLGEPPSADRLRKLIHFLATVDPSRRVHHRGLIARAVCPLEPPEEAALAGLIGSSEFPVDANELLLDVAGMARGSQRVFAAVAAWTGPGFPPEIRRGAFKALAAIDAYRAQDALVPLLDVDEPELHAVLRAIRGNPFRQNPKVVEPLVRLTAAVREQHRASGQRLLVSESFYLAQSLCDIGHPRFIGPLLEWSLAGDHRSAEWAQRALERCLGWTPTGEGAVPPASAWVR